MAYINEEKRQTEIENGTLAEKSFFGNYINEDEKRRIEQGLLSNGTSSSTVKNVKVNKNGVKKAKKHTFVKVSGIVLATGITLITLTISEVKKISYNISSLDTYAVSMEELIDEENTCLDEMLALYPEEYEAFVKLNNALIINDSLNGLPLERKLGEDYEPVIYEFDEIDLNHVKEVYDLYFEYKGTNEVAFNQICQRLADYQASIEKYVNEEGMVVVTDMAEIVLAAKVADTMNFDYNLMSNFEINHGITGSRLTFEYDGKKYTTKVIDNEGKYLLRQLMNNLEQEDLLISLSQVKYAASDTTELEVKKK